MILISKVTISNAQDRQAARFTLLYTNFKSLLFSQNFEILATVSTFFLKGKKTFLCLALRKSSCSIQCLLTTIS